MREITLPHSPDAPADLPYGKFVRLAPDCFADTLLLRHVIETARQGYDKDRDPFTPWWWGEPAVQYRWSLEDQPDIDGRFPATLLVKDRPNDPLGLMEHGCYQGTLSVVVSKGPVYPPSVLVAWEVNEDEDFRRSSGSFPGSPVFRAKTTAEGK